MNRWLVRSVRRATGDRPGARANRSITDGWNTTPGSRARPSDAAYSASFPAAHSRFFARSCPRGATAAITSRANAAACGDTDDGRHRPI